jgi:hypothetical protein
MRTTVTLDPEVVKLIRDTMRERGISFKEVLNQAVRAGLLRETHRRARRFVQKSFHLGEGQDVRWDKALAIAEAMEDEELSRKLSVRK